MNTSPEYTFSDYVAAVRRRRGVFFAGAGSIFFIAAAMGWLLPNQYTSASRIDINLEGSNVQTLEPIELTAYADQYIADMKDRALTYDNLVILARDSEKLPKDIAELSESDRMAMIRDSIEVSVLTQVVISPTSGREVDVISGIRVASVARDPDLAYQVATYVTQLMLDEDRRSRTEMATSTSRFLDEQMDITEGEILKLEKEIADFKVANACCLPELVDLNMSVMQRAERDLESIQPRRRTLEQDRAFLRAQIEELGQIVIPPDRLEELELEYMTLVANYGQDHPDVNRVRRELLAIAGTEADGNESIEIIDLRIKLREAEQKYSDEHPDVRRYRNQLALLEAQRDREGGDTPVKLLENPRYIQLRTELNSINSQLAELRTSEPMLRKKISEYEDRLSRTPQIESQYQALNRRLESARGNFDDLQERYVIARQTQALESTDIGARLLNIASPQIPIAPSGPPRLAILIVGVFLAGTVGLGAMLFAELADRTVRGSKDIEVVVDMVPLVTVPNIQNSVSIAEHKRRMTRILGASLILLAAIIVMYVSRGT